ncbi:MAG TPA: DUF4388 domain-containing protein [Thermoanaerobaculia bacterium]
MVPDPSSPEVREALEELQLYLADILPPLVVADAFKVLLKCPTSLTASHIQKWTAGQFRAGSLIKLSDYIFFAVKKVFLIGEFRLVPRGPFEPFLEELKELVLAFTPEAEREALRANLARIAESKGALTASVDALIRQERGVPQTAAAAPVVLSPEDLRGLRHFSLLLERLSRQIPDAGVPEPGGSPDVLAAALAAAVRSSHDPQELERNLERLREIGLETETSSIFRVLANSLPAWVPPEPPPGAPDQTPPESGAVEAMHRIVAQSEDPAQLAMRFNEMVKTAVERFNEGALPQAVRMLDLAERIVREKSVDTGTVEAVRSKGDEALDLERLRKFSEAQRYQALLRRFLNFFTATSPKGLLNELLREMKRERRKLILQLLEVHGAPARKEALDRLQSAFGQAEGDEKWYYRRNLLYLLRRIPPVRADVPPDEDLNAAVRHAVLRFPVPLVKEAVANLGQLKHERAESTLLTLLDDLEKMLLKPGDSSYDSREIRLLLDRVVAALARFGTARARRAVVDHGLKKKGELGDTVARLSELAGQDLSGDAEVVERLLAALKATSPHKVLGIVVHPNDLHAKHIIEALSTTPSAPVRQAFEGLANRFPNLEAGITAARALASLDGAARIPEALSDTRSGELELFGLPALVQNLAESGLSGSLTLKDAGGEILGDVVLSGGKMKSCEARGLKGEEAFYQLLERPTAGSFVFERGAMGGSSEADSDSLLEIPPLCLEGMRRYDELQQATALVPDDLKLKPTDVRPEHHPDELDGMFVNRLWKLASGDATPGDCDGALTADSYRIRRQLAFWVESGALTAA